MSARLTPLPKLSTDRLPARRRQPSYAPTELVLAGAGQRVDLMEIRNDLDFAALAEMLAKTPRFQGATNGPVYSVARHCLAAHAQAVRIVAAPPRPPRPEIAAQPDAEFLPLMALIHDAAEGLIGDVTRPARRLIAHFAGRDAVLMAELHAFHTVAASLGIPARIWHPDSRTPLAAALRQIDDAVLATEWRDLMPAAAPCPVAADPLPTAPILPERWETVQHKYLKTLAREAESLGLHAPGIAALYDRMEG